VIAFVGVSDARRQTLSAANEQVPTPQQVSALIDTGASDTCVDPAVLNALGLSPTGAATVNTPTTGTNPQIQDQYDVSLFIPGATATDLPLVITALPVISSELLAAMGFHALIGRDVLSRCLLAYNGTMRHFTIAY
jgi:hypothetical protein